MVYFILKEKVPRLASGIPLQNVAETFADFREFSFKKSLEFVGITALIW